MKTKTFYSSLLCFFLFLTLFSSLLQGANSREERVSWLKSSLSEQKADLAKQETFSAEELESFYRRKALPREGKNYQKLIKLLNSYDIAQPKQKFLKRKTLRVASFNIARGYSHEKHELIFQEDPVFKRIIEKFPELDSAESLDEALKLIRQKNPKNTAVLVKELYRELKNLLDPAQSNFTKIVTPEQIFSGLSSWEKLNSLLAKRRKFKTLYNYLFEISAQLNQLAKADVIAIQEADWGMPRTDHLHIIKNIAEKTGMGYLYGVEFLELFNEGVAYSRIKNKLNSKEFKGFHGNAILSKWPLSNPRILRYGESLTHQRANYKLKHRRCYDWWKEELPKVGPFERVVYQFSRLVFKEKPIVPSVRLGSRMALISDILTPEGKITFVSTHLENRGNQKCRQEEMKDLLYSLASVKYPVIIGGDFNTSNEEARRPYIRYGAYWWIRNNLQISSVLSNVFVQGLSLVYQSAFLNILPITSSVQFLNTLREWRNPHGPGSRERRMLENIIKRFAFKDGKRIDTRGTRRSNKEKSRRIFANSNQVAKFGYKPTYCFQRNYKKLFCMKLDWLLVKGDFQGFENWAPKNPRTMLTLPFASGISDHAIITADLTYPESKKITKTKSKT